MGQLLHAWACTTEKVRRDIQNSEERLSKLSKRYGINPKTVAKWRSRKGEGVADRKMGSKSARWVLSAADTKAILRRGKGPARRHRFTRACQKHGIRHKTTRPYRPQTHGQMERMNRTIKDATTKIDHYDSVNRLKIHLNSFMSAYNCAKKRSALKRKTPYEAILTWWQKQPELFNINPLHLWMGSYN